MFSNVKEFEKLGLEINTNGYKSYTTCKVDRFGTDPSKRKAGTVGCTMGSGGSFIFDTKTGKSLDSSKYRLVPLTEEFLSNLRILRILESVNYSDFQLLDDCTEYDLERCKELKRLRNAMNAFSKYKVSFESIMSELDDKLNMKGDK